MAEYTVVLHLYKIADVEADSKEEALKIAEDPTENIFEYSEIEEGNIEVL